MVTGGGTRGKTICEGSRLCLLGLAILKEIEGHAERQFGPSPSVHSGREEEFGVRFASWSLLKRDKTNHSSMAMGGRGAGGGIGGVMRLSTCFALGVALGVLHAMCNLASMLLAQIGLSMCACVLLLCYYIKPCMYAMCIQYVPP